MDDLMSMPGGQPTPDGGAPDFASLLHHGAIDAGVKAIKNSSDPTKTAIQAAKDAKKLGVGDPNELDAIISGKTKPFDYTFGAKHAGTPHPNSSQKTTVKKPNVTPDQMTSMMGDIRNDPQAIALQTGNDQMGESLGNILAMEQNSNGWMKPLASLADYVSNQSGNKGTASQGYAPNGMTDSERAKTLLTYQNDVQKRKEDLYKTQLTALNNYTKNQGNTTVQIGDGVGGSGLNSPRGRAERFHNEILRKLDNNPTLAKQLGTANALESSLSLIGPDMVVNPALMHDAMQSVRLNTVGGGKSIGDERADTYMSSVVKDWQRVLEKYGNKVSSIPQDDPQLQQVKQELLHVRNMVMKQREKLLGSISSGQDWMYDANPDLKASLDKKLSNVRGLTEDISAEDQPSADAKYHPKKIAAPAGKKDTKQMSIEELEAELAGPK